MTFISKQFAMSTAATYIITDACRYVYPACQQFRGDYLRALLSHIISRPDKEVDPCTASNHVNVRYPNTPENYCV